MSESRRRSAGMADHSIGPPIVLTKKSSSTSSMRTFFKPAVTTVDEVACHIEQYSILLMKATEHLRKAGEKLHKSSQIQNNSAIEDISSSLRQVLNMHNTQQLDFAQKISNVAKDFKGMKQENDQLIHVERRLKQLETDEKKIEKEISKIRIDSPSASGSDGLVLRNKLSERLQLAEETEHAEKLVHRYRNDSEVTKMFIFRRCVKSMSDAFIENAKKDLIVFEATRELAELVPAVATEDVYYMRYEGKEVSKRKVRDVRRSLEQPARVYEEPQESKLLSQPVHKVPLTPLKMGSSYKTTSSQPSPPPPYSPGTKFVR